MRRNGNGPPRWMVLGGTFQDPDALSEVSRQWNLDFQQLDRGRFESSLYLIGGPKLFVTTCRLDRKVEQRGEPPPGMLTFGIPMSDGMQIRWRGIECDGRNLMLFRPGTELDSISDHRFSVVTVSIAADIFFQSVEQSGRRPEEVLGRGPDVKSYSPEARGRLRRAANRLVRLATSQDSPSEIAAGEEAERELVEALVDAWLETTPYESRPMASSRGRALRHALDLIRDHADEPITLGELERRTGTTSRTLRYAFQEAFGLSPKHYLQAYRLHQVRMNLLRGDAETSTVSEAANEWGFWHMGQFAADYRKFFGELPSETLQRRDRSRSIVVPRSVAAGPVSP